MVYCQNEDVSGTQALGPVRVNTASAVIMYDGLAGQKKGILFVLLVLVIFMQGGLWAGRRRLTDNFPDNSLIRSTQNILPFGRSSARPVIHEHPIPKLMADAERNFRNLLSRQSKTLEDAVKEYRRRYDRNPPRGFDEWWRFARDNGVLMIDEYDNIVEDMEPFWELTGEQLRLRAALVSRVSSDVHGLVPEVEQAGHLPSVDLVRVENGKSIAVNIKDGWDVSARSKGFLLMIENFQDKVSVLGDH